MLTTRAKAAGLAAFVVLLFLLAHSFYGQPAPTSWGLPTAKNSISGFSEDSDVLPCLRIPAGDDVAVIMRTGATELKDKLPAHFNTTFRCYRNLVIFSDHEEVFRGHQVHDVLKPLDKAIKESNEDFEIYNRLQVQGHDGLRQEELSGQASGEGSKAGKKDNAGWRLDKWKFMPMMTETLRLQPDKEWYVFVESDSYVVWSNLLQWLSELDSTQPLYYGSEVQIGDDVFAHGGSVFVMSRPALEAAADLYMSNLEWWNGWTAQHWAGDCVLGRALNDAGIPLSRAWPMLQGGHPEKMDYTESKGRGKKLWCAPALSYHHYTPREMQRMFDFEQAWVYTQLESGRARTGGGGWVGTNNWNSVLHHGEVFVNFVLPQIAEWRDNWNNLSPELMREGGESTLEECRELCERDGECLQFSHGPHGCSKSGRDVMVGEPAEGVRSEWRVDRIEKWARDLDWCMGQRGWTIT